MSARSTEDSKTQPANLRRDDETAELAKPNSGGIGDATADLLPAIELALEAACEFGPGCPQRLGDAIRYALLAPGKRLRPTLVLMAAEACGGTFQQAMPGAVAVEMIHAYSLIHDDLPAMDDDDLRRGRPTVHIAFDQATAILAGDALQPLAVTQLCKNVSDPAWIARSVELLMTAAGPEQLVGGQADDLAAESEQLPESVAISASRSNEPLLGSSRSEVCREALEFLESIHRRKTGALFAVSLELGAVLSGASDQHRTALAAYAAEIGLAFQVVDDLLDHTADESKLGKRVGKDAGRGKLTYPGLLGIEQAKTLAGDLIASAHRHTSVFGPAAWRLNRLADYILARSH